MAAGRLSREALAEAVAAVPAAPASLEDTGLGLPEMLNLLRSTYPEVQFSLGGAIGENEIVVQAMAEAALKSAGSEFA